MNLQDINEPWENPKDLLNRKGYADFLTGYLASKEHPFVLNLNASWGAGKTFFLTHWRESIRCQFPTVYVNAWESDFSEDPLLAVMSAIHEQLVKYMPDEQKTIAGFSQKLKEGGRFVRELAPIITKALVHKTLGDEAGDEMLKSFAISTEDAAKFAEKSMGILLEDQARKIKSVKDFKIALSELIKSITSRSFRAPLFLFIDELDRCRPTYAIEMLETIKHLFSTDGIVFIIGTDSDQLQHSVRAIYGNDFDGGEYLRRFFDQEYKLPIPDYFAYCQSLLEGFAFTDQMKYGGFLPERIDGVFSQGSDSWAAQDAIIVFLAAYSTHYQLPLRTINQVVVRLDAILSNSDESWDGPFLLLLLTLQASSKGIIGWLRERCTKGDIHVYQKEIEEKLISGGDTFLWNCQGNFREQGNVNKNYTIADIGGQYLDAIESVHHAKRETLQKYFTDWSDLGGYAQCQMAGKRIGAEVNISDIAKYFDHVEMAGALS